MEEQRGNSQLFLAIYRKPIRYYISFDFETSMRNVNKWIFIPILPIRIYEF